MGRDRVDRGERGGGDRLGRWTAPAPNSAGLRSEKKKKGEKLFRHVNELQKFALWASLTVSDGGRAGAC